MRSARAGLSVLLAALGGAACDAPREPPIPALAGAERLDDAAAAQLAERRRGLAAARGAEQRGRAWGELGEWFDAYEQWPAAADCYRTAHRLSGEPRWLELLAHAERLAGHGEAAAARFGELLDAAPDRVAARTWAGELELEAGRFDAARRQFEAVLALEPGLVRARAGLARVALETGAPERAVEQLEACLAEQPDSGVLHHLLGRALQDVGEAERAAEHLRVAAAQGSRLRPVAMDDPLRAEVDSLRASGRAEGRRAGAALREGRYEDALERLREALAGNPADEAAALNLARAQARLGEPEAAVATMDALLARSPESARALEVRALARSLAGDEEGALQDFRASVARDPDDADARRQLARLLWSRGDRQASLPHWSRVAELEPADAQARYRRDEALAQLGRWAEALAALERDTEELPQPAAFRLLLARVLSVAPPPFRDGDRALELALAEHERAPRLRQAETVALAQAARGDFEAALRWERAALAAVRASGGEGSAGEAAGGDAERVAERLTLFEREETESRPYRDDEGRGRKPVPAP